MISAYMARIDVATTKLLTTVSKLDDTDAAGLVGTLMAAVP